MVSDLGAAIEACDKERVARAIRRSREEPLAAVLDEEESRAVDLILTGECLHGIGAFLAGKAPVFPDG